MSYTPEHQDLEKVTSELLSSLKEYRERAENRIMDPSNWNITHRLKLKSISNKIFELQIELSEL
jgi:hypothetical protein